MFRSLKGNFGARASCPQKLPKEISGPMQAGSPRSHYSASRSASGRIGVGIQSLYQFVRQWNRFEGVAANRNENEVRIGNELLLLFSSDFEVQPKRLCADMSDIDAHLQ